MSTRGMIAFRLNRKDIGCYNHSDSYPEGLGVSIVEQIEQMKNMGFHKVKGLVRQIRLVNQNDKPTPEDIARFTELGYYDSHVSGQTPEEWYCLLRKAQGSLMEAMQLGIMIDGSDFINDSLFCEWAYIVNLDTMQFEIYSGFQKKPHRLGRYGRQKSAQANSKWKPEYIGQNRYYPCALVKSFPLENVPDDWMKQCMNIVENRESYNKRKIKNPAFQTKEI